MNSKQIEIVLDFQTRLINSLTPEQREKFYESCEEHGEEGDIIDGIQSIIKFCEENGVDTNTPTQSLSVVK